MAISRTSLVRGIALLFLLLVGAGLAGPVAAEEAVLIPGATLFKPINPFYPLFDLSYRYIGINMHDDPSPVVVDYSQDPLATERALAGGVESAEIVVRGVDGDVVVIGESMGSMVASRLAAELADSAHPPSPDDVRFVLLASPEAGVAEYFREGTYIPFLNYRIKRIQQSPYPTSIVIGEYDPWADPPDRPWNLISTANALMGLIYVHGIAGWGLDLADVPPQNVTVDGSVTTYFVPTPHLPLTRPFRDLGVPDCLVDVADGLLRPIVDAGYRRHDRPGDSRPYLSDGRIRRDGQEEPPPSEVDEDLARDDRQSDKRTHDRRAAADEQPAVDDLASSASVDDSDAGEPADVTDTDTDDAETDRTDTDDTAADEASADE